MGRNWQLDWPTTSCSTPRGGLNITQICAPQTCHTQWPRTLLFFLLVPLPFFFLYITFRQNPSSANLCEKNLHNLHSQFRKISSNFGKSFLWLPQVLLLLSSHNGIMMFSWVLEAKTPDSISLITCMQIWFEEVFIPLEMIHLREGRRLHQNS